MKTILKKYDRDTVYDSYFSPYSIPRKEIHRTSSFPPLGPHSIYVSSFENMVYKLFVKTVCLVKV